MAFSRTGEPATKLQAARVALKWTQARTIWSLQHQAAKTGVRIAEASSLKTMLSRWENGDPVGRLYARLFCQVYVATQEELGLEPAPEELPLRVPRVPPKVDAATVEYFRSVFAQHLLADNLMGPHHLVDPVRAQAALLDRVIQDARGVNREELLVLACRYNEFTGWLYQDAGEPRQAERYTDHALAYATEIGDAREVAYVFMRKSNIAGDLGQSGRGLGLAEAALREQTRLPAQVRALILSQRGRALALAGEADEAARTLDMAFRAVDQWDGVPDALASYCNLPYVAMEAAACWDLLGRPETAVSIFERNAADWPSSQRRDHGLFLARLANAYAAQTDRERACATGWQALEVVSSATSARALRELQRLHSRLGIWRKKPDAADLSSEIRQLVGPT